MAMIELHKLGVPEGRCTYLDLRDGRTGHVLHTAELDRLPGAQDNFVLALGSGFQVNFRGVTKRFADIDYEFAKDQKMPDPRTLTRYNWGDDKKIVIKAGDRLFKLCVDEVDRDENDALKSLRVRYHELKEGRLNFLVTIERTPDGSLKFDPPDTQVTLTHEHRELLLSVRPVCDVASKASAFFGKPLPIVNMLFELKRGDGTFADVDRPKWIENVTIGNHYSDTSLDSTCLIRLNEKGRRVLRDGIPDEYKFTVVLFDSAADRIVKWDPVVIIDEQ